MSPETADLDELESTAVRLWQNHEMSTEYVAKELFKLVLDYVKDRRSAESPNLEWEKRRAEWEA